MTPADLAAIKARCEAAKDLGLPVGPDTASTNLASLVNALNDIGALVAEVERLNGVLSETIKISFDAQCELAKLRARLAQIQAEHDKEVDEYRSLVELHQECDATMKARISLLERVANAAREHTGTPVSGFCELDNALLALDAGTDGTGGE